MYKKIYVPVDNSAHSNQAIESALRVGKAFGSKLVGSHIYAAKMHDYRFKQMEYSLPEEYLEENELERQVLAPRRVPGGERTRAAAQDP